MTGEKESFNKRERESDGLGIDITQWLGREHDDQGGKECW
jgi:hypothetical protein